MSISVKDTDESKKRQDSGKKNTFEVTVRFQQNATWQGQILWVEKKHRQSFRSALEMLKFMDEAISENSVEAQNSISWEKKD